MASASNNLERLIHLASEPSSEKRRELLEGITDMFLGAPEPITPGENGLFDDVMCRVAQDVESRVRRQLAERLADLPQAPPNLISSLANDAIEVARPVLMRSPVLKDDDLVAIARQKGQDHLLALSARGSVSAQVTDAIVSRGNDTVIEALVRNQGASFSREGMESVVARSEQNKALQKPLIARGDVPADLMHDMFWWVSSQLRRYILETAQLDEALVDQMFEDTRVSMEREAAREAETQSRAEKLIRRQQMLGGLNELYLVQLLRQNQMPEFVVGLAYLTDIDIATARRVVMDETKEALAVACKANGFDRSTFSTMVLSTGKASKSTRSTANVAALLSLYDKVPVENAKRVMRFWRVRQSQRQAAASQSAA